MWTSRIKTDLSPFEQSLSSWKQPTFSSNTFRYSLTEPNNLPSFGQGQHVGGKELKEQVALPAAGQDASFPAFSHVKQWHAAITPCAWSTAALAEGKSLGLAWHWEKAAPAPGRPSCTLVNSLTSTAVTYLQSDYLFFFWTNKKTRSDSECCFTSTHMESSYLFNSLQFLPPHLRAIMHIYILTLARINSTRKKQDSLHSRYLYTLGQTCTISSLCSLISPISILQSNTTAQASRQAWIRLLDVSNKAVTYLFFFLFLLAIILRWKAIQ